MFGGRFLDCGVRCVYSVTVFVKVQFLIPMDLFGSPSFTSKPLKKSFLRSLLNIQKEKQKKKERKEERETGRKGKGKMRGGMQGGRAEFTDESLGTCKSVCRRNKIAEGKRNQNWTHV